MTSPHSGPLDRLSAEPVDLFAYGSLLFPEVLRVLLTDGRHAWAYVCPGHTVAPPNDWDIHTFERDHLTGYLKRCATWRQRYETSENGRL